MARRNQYQNRGELLQGALEMLVLQTLQWRPQHGYGIMQALRVIPQKFSQGETGSLHPALQRLERQRWVRSKWKRSESNQHAKYYRITAVGKKQLASDLRRWQRIVAAVGAEGRGLKNVKERTHWSACRYLRDMRIVEIGTTRCCIARLIVVDPKPLKNWLLR